MATRMKQKAAARKANADKRPRATAKYIRVTPRKVKIVVDLIRGKIYIPSVLIHIKYIGYNNGRLRLCRDRCRRRLYLWFPAQCYPGLFLLFLCFCFMFI